MDCRSDVLTWIGPGDVVGTAEGLAMPLVNLPCVDVCPLCSYAASLPVSRGFACRRFAKGKDDLVAVDGIVVEGATLPGWTLAGLRLGGLMADPSSAMGALILVLSIAMLSQAAGRKLHEEVMPALWHSLVETVAEAEHVLMRHCFGRHRSDRVVRVSKRRCMFWAHRLIVHSQECPAKCKREE